jgi:hypothetical protein
MSADDREAARTHLVELENELHDRRARLAELTRQVNLLAPRKRQEEPPRIPHSKLRVQMSAICGLLAGYGVQQMVSDANHGRLFGMATTAALFTLVNWFIPWPIRKAPGSIEVDPTRRSRAQEQALEDERRACEKLEREITGAQRTLGTSEERESR